jgi:hypothetical protein
MVKKIIIIEEIPINSNPIEKLAPLVIFSLMQWAYTSCFDLGSQNNSSNCTNLGRIVRFSL